MKILNYRKRLYYYIVKVWCSSPIGHTFNCDEIKKKTKKKYFYLVSLGLRQFNMEEENVNLILQLYNKQTDNVRSFSAFKVCIKKSTEGLIILGHRNAWRSRCSMRVLRSFHRVGNQTASPWIPSLLYVPLLSHHMVVWSAVYVGRHRADG